jgi:TonB family protein
MSAVPREVQREVQREAPGEVQTETRKKVQSGADREAQLHQTSHSGYVPQLLVVLPSRPRVFFTNLRDLILPRRLPRLELRSAPAPFWHDVFVHRSLPWHGFLKSGACHVLACTLLIAFTRLLALEPHVVPKPAFDRSQVVYYSPSEYLPPLDTRQAAAAPPKKADPEFARQPIISVPREPDNRAQTIVTPPDIKLTHDKLTHDLALPNIIAWSDNPQRPQLAVPPAPLTLAADITRIAPQLNSVVAPPPDASQLTNRRDQSNLQAQVVAPPPDIENTSRRAGEMNIGHNSVIAPSPSLAVAEQRSIFGVRSSAASQVVPPPPSAPASGSFGFPGRITALNLHPAVVAPPNPPAGNRRGSFAATPDGHAGATGSPGSSHAGTDAHGKENGSESSRKGTGDLPAGLYVGSVPKTEAENSASNSVNPNLMANARPPRVTNAMQPNTAAKLTEPERAVFGNRKFYSVTLNMPNLNSAGGSWIIRFAELHRDSTNSDSATRAAGNTEDQASDLSQPQATRKVDPAYPMELMRQNVAGTVILYAVIRSDGTVGNIRLLRGVDARLDQYAIVAISQWKFNPATKNGSPVDVEATFQIPFHPARAGTNF